MTTRIHFVLLGMLTLGLVAAPVSANTYRIINQTDADVTVECTTDSGNSSGGDVVAVTVTSQKTVPAGLNQDFTCTGSLVIQEHGLVSFQCQDGKLEHVTVATGDNGMQVSESCFTPGSPV